MARIQLEGILKLIDVDINPAIFQKISRAVSNLPVALQQTGKAAQDVQGHMQDLSGAIGRTNQQLDMGSTFANKFLKRMAQFAILLPLFATLNKALQGSVKFMTEFESELLNIARVNPKETLDKLGMISEAALDIGVQFGASSIEVIKTVKVFVQAGESIQSALEKARVATLATQVSTLSLVQAQELLIGVSKQFRSEALSDIDVLDKVAKVEDLSAADAGELADAFVTGGNALAFATKSFDDAIAIIAGLREQTRKSGREIGTFAKTLATRIFAAGDSRTALEDLGVAVEDQSGKLRPLLAVLKDTKTAFDGMTEAEQANAAKSIAGVRQFESLLATLQALDKIQQLSIGSSQSQGAALNKLSIVSEKLQFQVDQTIAEFQKLSVQLGDSGVLDFFKDAVKAARAFAIGLEGAVDLAKKLGVAIVPLIASGAFKLGQIAFGAGKAALGGATGGAAAGGGTAGGPGAVGPATLQRFIAFQAAASLLTVATEKLNEAFKNSTGNVKAFGQGLTNVTGGLATGAQVAAILGPKYGKLAFITDVLIKSFSDIIRARDEDIAASQEIVDEEKKKLAVLQVNKNIASGGDLGNQIIHILRDALGRQGGKVTADFFADAKKEIASAAHGIKEGTPGLTQAKNLDPNELFGNKGFLESIAKARPDFENLTDAIKNNENPAQLLNALLKDLGNSAEDAGKVVENFVAGLESVKRLRARDELRQQESKLNDLLVERDQLLRTDIPLFQSHVEQLRAQAEAMSKSLDVTEAVKKDFEQLAKQNPTALGFTGPTEDASKKAVAFLKDIEQQVLNINKAGGKFNLTDFLDKFNFDLANTDTEGTDNTGTNQNRRFEGAKEFLKIVDQGLNDEVKKLRVVNSLRDAVTTQEIEQNRAQVEAMQHSIDVITSAEAAFLKLGVTADTTKDDLDKLSQLTSADLKSVTDGTDNFDIGLKNILQTLAGTDLQQAEQQARISSDTFAKSLETVNEQIAKIQETIGSMKGDIDAASGKDRIELEKELGALETKRLSLTYEAQQENLKNTVEVLKARKKAEEDAIQKAKEMNKALDELADAQFKLKYGTEDAIKAFDEFAKSTRSDMLQKEADAEMRVRDAQKEVMSATSALSDTYRGLKDAVIAFNDSMAAAQIEAGMLGIQMKTLEGGLNTISSRVGALNQVFDSAIKDANISLKERIALEKQLASETLQFLQNARNEITNAGLDVFGQSPEQNSQLQQGIQGLQYVADKLGGSFDAFSRMNPQQFDKVSQELLSLPTQFRQQILDALRTLPSTSNIGGFSVEQLQTALGQVGSGINSEAGLPAIADLMAQEKEQLSKLQDLAIRDAELQVNQVVAALQQVDLAKASLEAAQVQADRASGDLVVIQDQLTTENDALMAAADQREKLTAELLKATDNATIRQIEAQAREFANQIPLFKDISAQLLQVVQAIGSLKSSQFSAEASIPTASRGWIPNYASGKLSAKEAFGLLRAGAREKRAMPAGAGLAVANTSETIIPHRFAGQIPNFAGGNAGSQIANGIQAINGTNAAIVAAITNSINSVIGRVNNNSQQDIEKLTLDKLDNILSTLQEISLSNATISSAVNVEQSTQTGAATAVQPININVNSNGKSVVQVAGLDSLQKALREAIIRAQNDNADQLLAPVNSAVESIFRVLRERGLMSSFGQGQ